MANETVSPDGVFVAEGDISACWGQPMTDPDGDRTWTATIEVPHGFTGYYTFVNGSWSYKEPCRIALCTS